MKKFNFYFAILLAVGIFIASCSNDDDNMSPDSQENGMLMLHFENTFGQQGVDFGKEFTTPENEKISFSRFEYILSNFVLTKSDGSTYEVPDSYYFMGKGEANPQLREMISLKDVPAGDYTSITFSVGVDEATNINTDNYEKGELSADVGMSWSWSTGYKFINWEGEFEHATKGKLPFYFHIGTTENYRTVTKNFDMPLMINGSKDTKAHFMVMPEKVFTGLKLNDLEVAENEGQEFIAVMVGPKDIASQIADNYGNMFMLHHSESNDKN